MSFVQFFENLSTFLKSFYKSRLWFLYIFMESTAGSTEIIVNSSRPTNGLYKFKLRHPYNFFFTRNEGKNLTRQVL